MITAIFATGPKGEFGNKDGTLPWGSFPEELDAFFHTVSQLEFNTILVGANTWATLPKSAKRTILDSANTEPDIFVFDPKKSYHMQDATFRIIKITNTIQTLFRDSNVLVLGGAYLLGELFNLGLVDNAYVSRVNNGLRQGFAADTHLNWSVYSVNQETTVVETGLSGEKDGLSFVQELRIYK